MDDTLYGHPDGRETLREIISRGTILGVSTSPNPIPRSQVTVFRPKTDLNRFDSVFSKSFSGFLALRQVFSRCCSFGRGMRLSLGNGPPVRVSHLIREFVVGSEAPTRRQLRGVQYRNLITLSIICGVVFDSLPIGEGAVQTVIAVYLLCLGGVGLVGSLWYQMTSRATFQRARTKRVREQVFSVLFFLLAFGFLVPHVTITPLQQLVGHVLLPLFVVFVVILGRAFYWMWGQMGSPDRDRL